MGAAKFLRLQEHFQAPVLTMRFPLALAQVKYDLVLRYSLKPDGMGSQAMRQPRQDFPDRETGNSFHVCRVKDDIIACMSNHAAMRKGMKGEYLATFHARSVTAMKRYAAQQRSTSSKPVWALPIPISA